MKPMPSLLAILVALIAFPATTAAQQTQDPDAESECEQICQAFPSQAPPGCTCTLVGPVGIGGSGPIDYENLSGDQLIDVMRAAEAERMAGIDNYWLVVHSNISATPVVEYYKRNPGGGGPAFRFVPPAEMQAEWYDTDPNLTPEQRAVGKAVSEDPAAMADAMAQAFDIAAPGIGKDLDDGASELGLPLPVGGAVVQAKMAEIADQLRAAAHGSREDAGQVDEQQDELQQLADAIEPLFQGRPALKGIYVPFYEGTARRYFVDREDWDKTYPEPLGLGPAWEFPEEDVWNSVLKGDYAPEWPQIGHGAVACLVLTFRGEANVDGGYTIEEAELWLGSGSKAVLADPVPIFLRMAVRQGGRRVVVERETTRWGWDETKRLYFASRVRDQVKGISGALPGVLKKIEAGGVNVGPPTPFDQARIMGESIGTPGANPPGYTGP